MADTASLLVADIISGTLRARHAGHSRGGSTTIVIDSVIVQRQLGQASPELLAHAKEANGSIRRRDVMAALPLSTGVVVGRVGDPDVQPTPLMYERVGGTNRSSVEVTR